MAAIGLLTIQLHLPGVASLKEKRSLVRPILSRLHREFNVSAAEVDRLDAWQETVLACSMVSNDPAHARRSLQSVLDFITAAWPDLPVEEYRIEII